MSNISDYGITAGAASQSAAVPHGAPEGWAPSGVNNWAREYMAGVSRWYRDQNGELSVGGSSAAFTLTSFESKAGSAIAAYSVMPLMVCRTSVKCAAGPTINIDGLGARALIKNGRTALEDGDLTSQQVFVIAYNHSRSAVEVVSPVNNVGVGLEDNNVWTGTNEYSASAVFHTAAVFQGLVDLNGRVAGPVHSRDGMIAAHKDLRVSRPTAATLDISAGYVMVENTAGEVLKLENVNVTIDLSNSGEGGLDTGSEASSTFYYGFIIHDGSAVSGLVSTSRTAPLMPSGFSFRGLVTAAFNDGSLDILNYRQVDKRAILDVTKQDQPAVTVGTTASLHTLTAPPDTIAFIDVNFGTANSGSWLLITETWQTNSLPSNVLHHIVATNTWAGMSSYERRVDASRQIRLRSSNGATAHIYTEGWCFD